MYNYSFKLRLAWEVMNVTQIQSVKVDYTLLLSIPEELVGVIYGALLFAVEMVPSWVPIDPSDGMNCYDDIWI